MSKEWAILHPAKRRAIVKRSRLKLRYGLTEHDYGVMLGKQEGLCALCAVVLDRGKHTHVDHDHNTGKNRALLCGNCNKALGLMRENPATFRAAADYLEFHQLVS